MVLLWIGTLAARGALAGRLAEVEENEAANWLPGSAPGRMGA